MTSPSAASVRSMILGLVPLLACLAACGDGAPPGDDAALRLPRAAIFGDEPSSLGRVDVTVTGEGVLSVNGRTCAFADLEARLLEASGGAAEPAAAERERPPLRASLDAEVLEESLEEIEEDTEEIIEQEIVAEEPVIKDSEIVDDGGPIDFRPADLARRSPKRTVVDLPARDPSPRADGLLEADGSRPDDVLLRIDERVPWYVVGRLLSVCAAPELKLYRQFIAVRAVGSGEPGAVAAFLPKDLGLCGGRLVVGTTVNVNLRARRAGVRPPPVAGALAARRELPDDALFLSLRAAALTPWGRVVDVAVAALRAGVYSFTFQGSPTTAEERSVADWIARSGEAGPFDAFVRGPALSRPAVKRLLADGRRSGLLGYANSVTMGQEEIIDEAPEDPGK